MSDIRLTFGQAYLVGLIIGALLGAVLGLLPLILGKRRGRGRLGAYGFLASIVSGAVTPLLAILVAGLFTWLVVREKPAAAADTPKTGDDSDTASE